MKLKKARKLALNIDWWAYFHFYISQKVIYDTFNEKEIKFCIYNKYNVIYLGLCIQFKDNPLGLSKEDYDKNINKYIILRQQ